MFGQFFARFFPGQFGASYLTRFLLAGVFLLHAAAWAAPDQPSEQPPSKRVGSWRLKILGVTFHERLILYNANDKRVLVWDPTKKAIIDLAALVDSQNAVRVHSHSISATGKTVFLTTYGPDPIRERVFLFDLENTEISPTLFPETRTLSALPVISGDDSLAYFYGSKNGKPSVWLFPLAEYVADLAAASAQPTGFYVEKLGSTDLLHEAQFSPESERLLGTRAPEGPASAVTALLPFMATPEQIRVMDIRTGKSQVLQGQMGNSARWFDYNRILFRQIPSGHLFLWDLLSDTTAPYLTEGSPQFTLSPNREWLLFQKLNPADSLFLRNLSTGKQLELAGTTNGAFDKDTRFLVLARQGTDQEPYVRVSLDELASLPRDARISVESFSKNAFGDSLPIFEVPKVAQVLNQSFQFQTAHLNKLDTLGWDLYVNLKNKSASCFAFETLPALYCHLIDENGQVLSRWEEQPEKKEPKVLAPGEEVQFDCGAVVENPLPVGFKGKIKFWLDGYEDFFNGEIGVP